MLRCGVWMKPALIFAALLGIVAACPSSRAMHKSRGLLVGPLPIRARLGLHGFWLQRHGIDGAYIPLPIRPGASSDCGAWTADGRLRRRQRHHPAQARRIRNLRYGRRYGSARRRGKHAGVSGWQDRRQQHRWLRFRRQPAGAWRGPGCWPGIAAGCRRFGTRRCRRAAGCRSGRSPWPIAPVRGPRLSRVICRDCGSWIGTPGSPRCADHALVVNTTPLGMVGP